MKITATEEYGLRLLLQLAARQGRTASLAELAQGERLPAPVAAKVLLRLRRGGLVVAVRGRRGGYRLAADPQRITVSQALRVLGQPLFHRTFCAPRRGAAWERCHRLPNCSLRPVWSHLDALLEAVFRHITLAQLLAGEDTTRTRLAALGPFDAMAAAVPAAGGNQLQ